MKSFEQNYRWLVVKEQWANGEKDLSKIAEKIISHEKESNLKLRSIKKERTVEYYAKIARWFLITATKKGLITDFTFRKITRKPKTEVATNEEAQVMVNSGEATIPVEAVVPAEVAMQEVKSEEAIVTL